MEKRLEQIEQRLSIIENALNIKKERKKRELNIDKDQEDLVKKHFKKGENKLRLIDIQNLIYAKFEILICRLHLQTILIRAVGFPINYYYYIDTDLEVFEKKQKKIKKVQYVRKDYSDIESKILSKYKPDGYTPKTATQIKNELGIKMSSPQFAKLLRNTLGEYCHTKVNGVQGKYYFLDLV